MKTQLTLAAAIAVGATGAYAGGADRSGQSINAIFEDGNYLEFSLGYASPSVSGVSHAMFGSTPSGNMAPSYMSFGAAVKTDISDKFSLGVILDQPFGADVDYSDPGYYLSVTNAQFKATGITILGKYQATDRISVYAGPRIVSASGHYTLVAGGTEAYTSTYSSDSDVGYVVGAAYEIPDIAMRAAFTYSSQTDFALDGTGAGGLGDLSAVMPQSVNIDLQSGIAADTLAFVNIRWADWSEAHITDAFVLATPLIGGEPLTEFGNKDTWSYTVGVGRKFSEKFSGQASIGYEKSSGAVSGNLAPTDGYWSLALGGAYDIGNGAKISGGIRYVKVGDTTTSVGTFADNSAFGIGLKFSQSF